MPIRPVKIDGAELEINWAEFDRGDSFFIPCLNRAAATTIIKRKAASLLFEVAVDHRIEDGFRGIRVWRL